MKFKKFVIRLILFTVFSNSVFAAELTANERLIKQSILYAAGNNYLENAYYANGKILRWNTTEFPIKVFIDNSVNAPDYYNYAFIRAVLIWQSALKDILSIDFTANETEADIVFKVTDNRKLIRKIEDHESTVLAYTSPVINKNILKKQLICVYQKNRDNQYYKPHQILNIALHEFGHALGIMGHSGDKTSIMYALYGMDNDKKSGFISRADINTIMLLYKVKPDITNGDVSKETGTIRAELLLGDTKEREDVAIQKALNEIKIKPKDCLSRLKLAVLYEEKNNYPKMLNAIKEAEPLAQTNEEIYSVYVSYAYYYFAVKNKQNAKKYLEKALQIKNDGSLKELQFYINKL